MMNDSSVIDERARFPFTFELRYFKRIKKSHTRVARPEYVGSLNWSWQSSVFLRDFVELLGLSNRSLVCVEELVPYVVFQCY